jgi:hypothetical protein
MVQEAAVVVVPQALLIQNLLAAHMAAAAAVKGEPQPSRLLLAMVDPALS